MQKKTRRIPRKRPLNRWRRLTGSVLGTGLCLGGITAGALWSLRGGPLGAVEAIQPPFGGKRHVNILVLGLDDGQGGQGRSDSMLLVRIDTLARQIAALSIPRDTRVAFDDGRFAKINSAHARGGPRLAAHAVEALTGLPVDYTVTTDFGGFTHLVDLVGGIDLDIERPMDYVDHWGHLEIHLKPGIQHLDGSKAIQYVRYRKSCSRRGVGDGSDISRIARQQRFLQAIAARCLATTNLVRLTEIVREGRRQVRTDLGMGDLVYIAGLAKEIGADRLKVLTVPGKTAMIGGQSYWLPAEEKMAAAVQQLAGTPPPSSGAVDPRIPHRG